MCSTRTPVLLATVLWLLPLSAVQAALTLPPPGSGLSETHGDFEAYSLPFLENLLGSSFNVQSGPGQIQDAIVILTGTNNAGVNANPSGIEQPYQTPTGGGGDSFNTEDSDPLGGDPSVDSATVWDADVGAIRTALNGGDLVFFFNLNEQNARDGQGLTSSQDILAWAQLDLIDSSGILPTLTFFFSAANDPLTAVNELANGLLASATFGAPDPDAPGASLPGLDDQWAYIHGIITVAADGTFLHYGAPVPGDPAGASTINQNLGQDDAAFALFNSDLNDLVQDPNSGYDRLSIDIRLARLNNGYEQSFVLAGVNITDVPAVPEAASVVAWLGLSVCATAATYFRRRRRA